MLPIPRPIPETLKRWWLFFNFWIGNIYIFVLHIATVLSLFSVSSTSCCFCSTMMVASNELLSKCRQHLMLYKGTQFFFWSWQAAIVLCILRVQMQNEIATRLSQPIMTLVNSRSREFMRLRFVTSYFEVSPSSIVQKNWELCSPNNSIHEHLLSWKLWFDSKAKQVLSIRSPSKQSYLPVDLLNPHDILVQKYLPSEVESSLTCGRKQSNSRRSHHEGWWEVRGASTSQNLLKGC